MRRRRRTKYTWFPQLGTQAGQGPDLDVTPIFITVPLAPANTDPSDVNIFPIIPDAANDTPPALAGPGSQLVDFVGSEYILKRIVGKLNLSAQRIQIANEGARTQDTTSIISAGFFVARQDESSATGLPVGSTTAAQRAENYGPLNLSNTREPWIWRRTWVLSPQYVITATGADTFIGAFPRNNYTGSVAEGSHIDAKTSRRVGNDDRLYFAIQTMGFNVVTNPMGFELGLLDVRVLGALRRSKGRSAF